MKLQAHLQLRLEDAAAYPQYGYDLADFFMSGKFSFFNNKHKHLDKFEILLSEHFHTENNIRNNTVCRYLIVIAFLQERQSAAFSFFSFISFLSISHLPPPPIQTHIINNEMVIRSYWTTPHSAAHINETNLHPVLKWKSEMCQHRHT